MSLELERIFSLSESYVLQKEAYALSKLYNFLLAKELAKHYEKEGVIANTADTGIVLLTNITNNLNPFEMIHLFFELGWEIFDMRFVGVGAANVLYTAIFPTTGGTFYSNCKSTLSPNPLVYSNASEILWETSMKIFQEKLQTI